MQTFLPYADFQKSAEVLDRQRLGKQRVETLQILRTLHKITSGWRNHPAVRMWAGYEAALVCYGGTMCNEWVKRGYMDTCLLKLFSLGPINVPVVAPPWLGDTAFHASHRAALLAKAPDWYGQFGWADQARIEYIWPVSK